MQSDRQHEFIGVEFVLIATKLDLAGERIAREGLDQNGREIIEPFLEFVDERSMKLFDECKSWKENIQNVFNDVAILNGFYSSTTGEPNLYLTSSVQTTEFTTTDELTNILATKGLHNYYRRTDEPSLPYRVARGIGGAFSYLIPSRIPFTSLTDEEIAEQQAQEEIHRASVDGRNEGYFAMK